jgi:nicotinate-nucleotide adenylyltransferase
VSGARVGMLGGTFDPPHLGHLVLAVEARWQLGLHRVLLVPAREPPHKPDPAMGQDLRVRLLRAAIAGEPGLEVSELELRREGPSYTADTLEELGAGGDALWFLLGADALADLPRWHAPERILAAARLAVAPRAGQLPQELALLAEQVAPGRTDLLDFPQIGVSSRMIRARMARGEPVRHLLPRGVEEVLRQEGLLASPPDGTTPGDRREPS